MSTVAGWGVLGRRRARGVGMVVGIAFVLGLAANARADQAGTISPIAGTGENTSPDQTNLGDGGPALSATMFLPHGVAVASDGTIYFADTANFRVRRIRTDGVIETIAGTGVLGNGGNGLAVHSEISDVLAIALDPTETHLHLADTSNHAVRRVNLVTGVIEEIAQLPFPQGIAVDGTGQVLVSETVSCVIRRVDPSTGLVTTFAGSGQCDSQPGTAATAGFYFPTRLSIDDAGNVYVVDAGTDTVRRIDALTTNVTTVAGGGSTLPGSGLATSFHIGLVTDVAAGAPNELFVSNETRVFRIDLTTGQLTVYAGTGVPDIDDACSGRVATACNFNNVGGLAYHDATNRLLLADGNNARIRAVVPPPSDGLSFTGTTLTTIACPPGVAVVPGDLTISNNANATVIECVAVEVVDGDVTITSNPQAETINLVDVQVVGDDVTITGNEDAAAIHLGNLISVDGSVTITNNGAASVNIGNLQTVSGNVSIESTGTGNFDAGACVQGVSNIDLAGYASVSATTAMGGTTLTMDGSMALALLPGAFPTCVGFSVVHVANTVETGTDAEGSTVRFDTLLAYQFIFAVPALGVPAELTFDLVLSKLDATRQAEVLDAVANGNITLVTQGDDPGATYQSFRVCTAGEPPTVDGCVTLQTLDANGNPASGTPAIIRFSGLVGHFSTWGVAIVTPATAAPVFNGLLQPYPAPPRAATPTFKRGSVVPLKFNWLDPAGAAVNSATASPSVTIYPGTCSGEPTTTALPAEDAGQSDGWRYDADTQTWIFGWSTRSLAAGCYWIQLATASPVFRAPVATFPISLQDR